MPETSVPGRDVTASGRTVPAAAADSAAASSEAAAIGSADSGYELATARWPEVAAQPRQLLVVPLGSLEQHGPHLPLDTDTRIAVAVARRACAVVAGTADGPDGDPGPSGIGLTPPIPVGASGEHADFPGTLSIGHVALSTLLLELGRHASLHWPTMLIVNGHGGNVGAISDAAGKLRSEGRDCRVWHAGARPAMLASAGLSLVPDAHAGRVETSIMLALAPGDVLVDAAAPGDNRPLAEILPDLREHGVGMVSPNGVLGDPSGASAAEGEALLRLLVADLAATIAPLAGRQPLLASFDGVIAPPTIFTDAGKLTDGRRNVRDGARKRLLLLSRTGGYRVSFSAPGCTESYAMPESYATIREMSGMRARGPPARVTGGCRG